MPYTPILATLGYVFSADRRKVLMVHRIGRENDAHLGKWNGLGGKLEPGEDAAAGMIRELHEEAGIVAQRPQLAATISWPGFGKGGEDWFGFLFRIFAWSGEPYCQNPEGTLAWVPLDEVMQKPLWEGDRYFLPMILKCDHPLFHGCLPYQNGHPASWTFTISG
jgi:8-oxo-dGTP diphosphatase